MNTMHDSKSHKLHEAQLILGYHFADPELLWEALQAPGSSCPAIGGRALREGNKPLAGVGDGVLRLVLRRNSWRQGETIGDATTHLSHAAGNDNLVRVCDGQRLTACINGNPAQRGAVPPRTKCGTVEAVLGAAFLDGGLAAAEAVMLSLELLV